MDISLPISLVSAILTFALAFQAYRAFKYAKKDYLLNFSAGFLLLALSYSLLIPLALGFKLPAGFEDADDIINYPAFAGMQTVGYALIALAYFQTRGAKQMLAGLLGLLAVLVFVTFLPGVMVYHFVDILLYLTNVCLIGFVLYHMLKVMPPTDLVFAGFLVLALHEYTALEGSVNESIYNFPDAGSFLIAELLRIAALGMLFVSFLMARSKVRHELVAGSALYA